MVVAMCILAILWILSLAVALILYCCVDNKAKDSHFGSRIRVRKDIFVAWLVHFIIASVFYITCIVFFVFESNELACRICGTICMVFFELFAIFAFHVFALQYIVICNDCVISFNGVKKNIIKYREIEGYFSNTFSKKYKNVLVFNTKMKNILSCESLRMVGCELLIAALEERHIKQFDSLPKLSTKI